MVYTIGMSRKEKNIEKKTKKTKSKIRKYIKRTILGLLAIIFVVIVFLCIKYGPIIMQYKSEAESMVASSSRDIFMQSQTSIVYDKDGNVLAELSGSKESEYLKNSEIPQTVKDAFIVSEDRKFYEHSGVDYKAVGRAILEIMKNEGEVTQGGSTITQQLARNIYLTHEVSVERKLKEMFIAWELEKLYSKDEILEFYINNIYFGNGLYGIEAASEGYFNKKVSELSISQMVFLCAIPNNPTLYEPFENMENTLKRRDRILKQMYEQDVLTQSEYLLATSENVVLSPSEKIINNYEETFIRYCATLELMKLRGFEFKYRFSNNDERNEYSAKYQEMYEACNAMLFTQGYRIYTSIDKNLQEMLQNSIDEYLKDSQEINNEGIYALQASGTCIDNNTGYVVAIVGGRTNEYDGYTLNRAYQSYRQPGSSIKPLIVYTPAFEMGYTPDTLVVDEKIEGGPKNATNYYIGNTNVRTAVEQSINTIAWKLVDEVGLGNALGRLYSMGFKKIVPEDYVNAVAIGGFTYGTNTLEMASAYATIENDGMYRTPTCITKITDDKGNVIIDNGNNTEDQLKIYEGNASRIMTNILKGVLENGTGVNYAVDNAICAGKTGTTNDTKDVWFAGYSRYYTTAVWCGYDIPRELDEYYRTCAGRIWQNYMTSIHEGTEIVDFEKYYDVISEKPIYQPETSEPVTDEESFEIPSEMYQDETTMGENTENRDTNVTDETTTRIETTTNIETTSVSESLTHESPAQEDITTEDMEQYTTGYGEEGMYTESWN